ncbi:unnamed protein product [Effrenium voratum]|nr:unnamed protein product [Effrenium voratum]
MAAVVLRAPASAHAATPGPGAASQRGTPLAGGRLLSAATVGAHLAICGRLRGRPRVRAARRAAGGAEPPRASEPQWAFGGRVWFRPALVQTPEPSPPEVTFLSLFGWSLGGVVCLEYDESPCGPYREVVDMGALVLRNGAVGQWGSRLCVSSKEAEQICREIWQVPAEQRQITFAGDSKPLRCSVANDAVDVAGWEALRLCDGAEGLGLTVSPSGRLPVWWTPQIKALWLPFRLGGPEEIEQPLALHQLFLSAVKVSLQWRWPGEDKATTGEAEGLALPFSILADGVKIEICPSFGKL